MAKQRLMITLDMAVYDWLRKQAYLTRNSMSGLLNAMATKEQAADNGSRHQTTGAAAEVVR
jgi:hypothetical protein